MKKNRMKSASIRFMILVTAVMLISACKTDDPRTQTLQEIAFEKLAGTWDMSQGGSVVVDGQDISLNFPGFSLSFTDGGYNTTNAGDLFKSSGTWTWLDDTAGTITLDDNKAITIVTLTESQFVFSFSFAGTGGTPNGIDGIAGNYTITVNK